MTAAVLGWTAALHGQVVIDMPPPPPPPPTDQTDQTEPAKPVDVGAVALARYAGARTRPVHVYSSPGWASWRFRRVGFFPPGLGFQPHWGFSPYRRPQVLGFWGWSGSWWGWGWGCAW